MRSSIFLFFARKTFLASTLTLKEPCVRQVKFVSVVRVFQKRGGLFRERLKRRKTNSQKRKRRFPFACTCALCLAELNDLTQEDASIRKAFKRQGETAQKEVAFMLITRFKSRLFPESDMDMKEWLGETDHVHLSSVLIKNVFPKLERSVFVVPDIQKVLKENPDIKAAFE